MLPPIVAGDARSMINLGSEFDEFVERTLNDKDGVKTEEVLREQPSANASSLIVNKGKRREANTESQEPSSSS